MPFLRQGGAIKTHYPGTRSFGTIKSHRSVIFQILFHLEEVLDGLRWRGAIERGSDEDGVQHEERKDEEMEQSSGGGADILRNAFNYGLGSFPC